MFDGPPPTASFNQNDIIRDLRQLAETSSEIEDHSLIEEPSETGAAGQDSSHDQDQKGEEETGLTDTDTKELTTGQYDQFYASPYPEIELWELHPPDYREATQREPAMHVNHDGFGVSGRYELKIVIENVKERLISVITKTIRYLMR